MSGSTQRLTMVKALNAGLRRALEDDPAVLLAGEDIGALGGVFRVTEGLQKDFGADRVMDSPLAEAGIVGTAIGLAMRGYRPVVEIQFDGFLFPGFDQMVTQLAKLRFRTAGRRAMGVVVRVPYGGGIGAIEHHSESPEVYFAHTPGLKVMTCGDPADAYWGIQQAVACEDPVIFLEPKRRYHDKGEVDLTRPTAEPGRARTLRDGEDATLVCYGPMVRTCLEAADAMAAEGRSVGVLDLRSLAPIDWAAVIGAARRTGRMVVVHEAQRTHGLGAEIAARVAEQCFYELEAPVLRVAGFDTPYPPSRMESDYLPDLDRVCDAVDRACAMA